MTDAPTPETKQGPPNPGAEGVDSPTPPGGPQRQDGQGPDGDGTGTPTGGHDDSASGSATNDRHASETGGHTIPLEDEQPGPGSVDGDTLQEENAGSSLDQPSEG